MKIIVNTNCKVAPALEHVLKNVLAVAAESIETSNEKPTGAVAADGQTYNGLVAVLQVLRTNFTGADASKKAFLSGTNDEERILINQWVAVAARLVAEAKSPENASVFTTVADVDHVLEAHQLHGKFLAATKSASIADVLFYGAVHNGRTEEDTKALPSHISEWSAFAQADANIAPIKSAFVAKSKAAGKASVEASVYVKPSEEEILRRRAEKEKAKKEKEAQKAAAAAAAAAAAGGNSAAPEQKKKAEKPLTESTKNPPKKQVDASSLDVRVGQFTNVRSHPSADRLYVEDMNLGEETRTIVSGLVEHFKDPKDLEGKLILVMCNMKPKPLLGVTSHGMILCASNEEGLALVSPPEGAKPGDRIVFGDKYSEPGLAPEILSSNKMSEALSHLRTNDDGVLCWKETPAYHANGIICCPTKKNCLVK